MTQLPTSSKEFTVPGTSTSFDHNKSYTAGFRLLDKFQNQWAQIHSRSQANMAKARTTLAKVDHLEMASARRLQAINDFVNCYRSLSKLDEQIDNIRNDLTSLESSFVKIEDLLIVLKNHKENVDAKQYVEDLEVQYLKKITEQQCLSDYRKSKLKIEHLQRVESLELQQRVELDERRQILEKAFEEEKSKYLELTKGKQTE